MTGQGEDARRPPSRRRRPPKPWFEPVDGDGHPVELDEQQAERLYGRGLNFCVWHLGRSAKTRHELAQKLARKGVPDPVTDKILARLEDLGYLDDAEYARNFVRSRVGIRKRGSLSVRADLHRKGIPDPVIETALAGVDDEVEAANARALVEKKLAATRGVPHRKRVARLAGMLARRGYTGDNVWPVIDAALRAETERDGDATDETV